MLAGELLADGGKGEAVGRRGDVVDVGVPFCRG